jgi:putative lipase involved disintegration of autophagic bodies
MLKKQATFLAFPKKVGIIFLGACSHYEQKSQCVIFGCAMESENRNAQKSP